MEVRLQFAAKIGFTKPHGDCVGIVLVRGSAPSPGKLLLHRDG